MSKSIEELKALQERMLRIKQGSTDTLARALGENRHAIGVILDMLRDGQRAQAKEGVEILGESFRRIARELP